MAGRGMGGGGVMVAMAALLVAAAMMMAGRAEAAISCGTVQSKVTPCAAYLENPGSSPSTTCCDGVESLYTLTKGNIPDQVQACKCIKPLASALGSKAASRISSLPGACGVSYQISASTNCNSIGG